VGFYTKRYEGHAKQLIDDLLKFDISFYIEEIDDLGDWHKNTHYKPTFILECLNKFKLNIVYLDCDANIKEYPSLFDNLDCDVACWRVPRKYGGHLSNGTIFLKNNKRVKEFVKHWENKCKENQTDCFEQEKFERAVNETGVLLADLPITYCQIFDFPIKPSGTVIVHNQASRYLKGRQL